MPDSSPPHPTRRNTAEEIRQFGAAQATARTRGLVALGAGLASALALGGAFLILSRPRPAALPAPSPAAEPAAVLREEPEPPSSAPSSRPNGPTRPGRRRSRDPIAALEPSRRVELPRPSGSSGPTVREQPGVLEDLARSLAAQKKGAIQLCFEHELKRDPRLSGTVTVSVELKAPHRIGRVKVKDDLKRKRFTRCVRGAMRSLDFPTLGEDVTVELPFALKAPEF